MATDADREKQRQVNANYEASLKSGDWLNERGNAQISNADGTTSFQRGDNEAITLSGGRASGYSLGRVLMDDPTLKDSRNNIRAAASQYSGGMDQINQEASSNVQAMRYKGQNMNSLQQGEMQRKLASDIGAQQFEEKRTMLQDVYDMDLSQAKYLSGMAIAGEQVSMAGEEAEKGWLTSLLGG